MLKKPTRTIAEALMDQSGVAGVGNYIKAECLLRAGISPWRNVTEITSEEYVKLCGSVIDVATESYEAQGASIRTYRNVDGSKGRKQFEFEIYSRKECPKGHPTIREETPEGRTSWWCGSCQK
jgi:endonuclease-8